MCCSSSLPSLLPMSSFSHLCLPSLSRPQHIHLVFSKFLPSTRHRAHLLSMLAPAPTWPNQSPASLESARAPSLPDLLPCLSIATQTYFYYSTCNGVLKYLHRFRAAIQYRHGVGHHFAASSLFFAFLGPRTWPGARQVLHKYLLNEHTWPCSLWVPLSQKCSVEPDPFIFSSILFRHLLILSSSILLPHAFVKVISIGSNADLNFPSWWKRSIINCWRWLIDIWRFIILFIIKTYLSIIIIHSDNISRNQRKTLHPDSWHPPDQFLFFLLSFGSCPCAYIICMWLQ